MRQSGDDTPTGPIDGRTQRIRTRVAPRRPPAAPEPTPRWGAVLDLTAAVLLVTAALLPWNLYFGIGVPGSNGILFAVLGAVTLLSLAALAAGHLGAMRSDPARAGRLCLGLNVPYLLLVLAFVGFDAFETVRFGGTVHVPGGVGPGAWAGVAGALLSARPAVAVTADGRSRSARIIGYASMAAAALSFGYNLYWRVRYALGGSDFGKQNVAVIATAVVYGTVALVAVVVASGWLLRSTRATRLATVALGSSALAAGTVVWLLPVGRDIDAFHGIAQNTSTAGVGFEGYLAWAAAAAIFAPRTLMGRRDPSPTEESTWRTAARDGLLLIAVWCLGSAAMRITDLAVAVSLDYRFSRYDSIVLAGFDLGTAVLAIWLRANLAHPTRSARLISALCGLVATLSISRVILGVALAPRFADSPNPAEQNPVYGNNLAQQLTSAFDVTLCGIALCTLAASIITGQLHGRRLRRRKRPATPRPAPGVARPVPAAPTTRVRVSRAARPSTAATTRIATGAAGADTDSPTTVIPRAASAPRIFRGDDSATGQLPAQKPRIFRPEQGTE